MNVTGWVLRLLGGLALGMALAAGFASAAGAQGDGPGAGLTIHNRICPVGFEGPDYYGACHDTPQSAELDFTVDGPETRTAPTDPSGNVSFFDLADGTYAVTGGPPGDFTDLNVWCSSNDGGAAFPFSQDGYVVTLTLAAGDMVTCDWYSTPIDQGGRQPTPPPAGGGTVLNIYKATCPAGYEGDDYFGDCFENATADVTFTVSILGGGGVAATGTTGEDGVVSFEVAAGSYVIEEDIPGEFATFVAYCTAGGQRLDFGYSADRSRIAIDLPAGVVRCDWYNVPFDLRGEEPTATAAPAAAPAATRPVTALPNTGSGAGGGGIGAGVLAAVAALAGVGAAGAALRARRGLAG